MYLRAVHAEQSIPVLRQLIIDNPLGILTTAIPSDTYPLIQSSHIPFVLDVPADDDAPGVLRGHLARQNPQSKTMIQAAKESTASTLEQEVMVLFQAPVHHYVTPKYYVETKPSTGKVVPTWNYAATQAYGKAKLYYDSKAEETISFLGQQINDLTKHGETSVMGFTGSGDRPGPWKVSDAPESYISILQKNIIGIEIAIDRLEGKFKMSQEMSEGDRNGVADGFQNLKSDVGSQMAGLVRERGEIHDQASSDKKVKA